MRRSFAFLAVLGLSVLIAATSAVGASASDPGKRLGHLVRFDLVQIVQGTVLAGGVDKATDTRSGFSVSFTGSGDFKPGARDATGGGTIVRRHDGTEAGHGVWVVTGFVDWRPAGGHLPAGLTDGIGHADDASAGIATFTIEISPSTGGHFSATLEIHCSLLGASPPTEEGIVLRTHTSDFTQAGGVTLFHVED